MYKFDDQLINFRKFITDYEKWVTTNLKEKIVGSLVNCETQYWRKKVVLDKDTELICTLINFSSKLFGKLINSNVISIL